MIKKIIISHFNNIAAIIENSKIQELIVINNTYQVNDIYIGTVQKIFTSINAAFVKLNYHDKSGFIHVNDLKYINPRVDLHLRSITDALAIRQKLLVQIIKEPTKSKGPRLTTNIHLSGQYLVLMPFNNKVCVSQKIYDESERVFLRAFGILIKPSNTGILFKDSSRGIKEKVLIEELSSLRKQWDFIEKSSITTICPSLINYNDDLIRKILIDYLDREVDLIVADSVKSLQRLYEYLQLRYDQMYKSQIRLQLYEENTCILEAFRVNSTIFEILKIKIELDSGIYIFIESSEALTIIDVNSGSFNQNLNSYDSILQTNCLAASEIAYQLQVRNINGIIIIDFIDMKTQKDQLKLIDHLSKVLKDDRARPEIVQLSELGLVELTRRRRGQSLKEIFGSSEGTERDKQQDQNSMSVSHQKNLTMAVQDINATFFNKRFRQLLKVRNSMECNVKRHFSPLAHRYIIPLQLYHSMIDNQLAIL
uniref:Ribonuclease E n=1 Tax=Nemalion vermiculare TaxID=935621 RepID=UPI0025806514|nr:Ribonuclease E [Nemalion vermiculare]WGV34323.1 Ribonuclease E [Nemalion vermiculare]